ncbi:MAG: hypothetical protein R2826_07845 [Thermoleophilia bacterium]
MAPEVNPQPAAPQSVPSPAYGEVYDRGYAHYEGARLGRRQAFRALVRYSAGRALGRRKKWTSKIIPFALYIIAAGMTAIIVGIQAFVGRFSGEQVLGYAQFFGFIFIIEGLFVATIAPEMLCPDRRENVLTLYFSKAITRLDYVLAKLTAAALLTLTISFVPAALLWLFFNLLADSPLRALGDNIADLGRIAIIGGLIALYLGAIGMAIASFTGRKAIAVVAIIVGYIVTEAIVNSLAQALADNPIADWITFLSPAVIINSLAQSLFPFDNGLELAFHWWAYALGMLATIAVATGITVWRYLPER